MVQQEVDAQPTKQPTTTTTEAKTEKKNKFLTAIRKWGKCIPDVIILKWVKIATENVYLDQMHI